MAFFLRKINLVFFRLFKTYRYPDWFNYWTYYLFIFVCFCLFCHFLKVALNPRQISLFSYEQATAVTDEQLSVLSDVQRTALAMVLTPWENRPVDFRGKLLQYLKLCHFQKLNFPSQNSSGEHELTSLKALCVSSVLILYTTVYYINIPFILWGELYKKCTPWLNKLYSNFVIIDFLFSCLRTSCSCLMSSAI